MDRYTVAGSRVQHSLSPRIHALFAEQTQQRLQYDYTLAADERDFARAVAAFFADGTARGMNITMPFKAAALQAADDADDLARRAGAANTLARTADGGLRAHNTDGAGLVADLSRLGAPLAGARVLLLGAGGAARGIVPALVAADIAGLHIANRTEARAQALADDWRNETSASAGALDALPPADLVINATAAGQDSQPPPIDPGALRGAFCYDLSYADAARAFMALAGDAGAAQAHDGLGMLVEQAAESFAIWRGVRPETASVLQQLREDGA